LISLKTSISSNVGDILKDTERRMENGLDAMFEAIESSAVLDVPVKTGNLMFSIEMYLESRWEGTLIADTPYASYLHYGTGIYGPYGVRFEIRPRHKKALWRPGLLHPVKRVVQDGIEPRDFLRDAVNEWVIQPAFDEGFKKGVR
jgi:hypothetical protein